MPSPATRTQLSPIEVQLVRAVALLPPDALNERARDAETRIIRKYANAAGDAHEPNIQRAWCMAAYGRAPEKFTPDGIAKFAAAYSRPIPPFPLEKDGFEERLAKEAHRLDKRVDSRKLELDAREKLVMYAAQNGYLSKQGAREYFQPIDSRNAKLEARERYAKLSAADREYEDVMNPPSPPDRDESERSRDDEHEGNGGHGDDEGHPR